MALTCKIRWIDGAGKPTPDDNEAVALCWIEPHDEDVYGRIVHTEQSDVFPICADHLARLQIGRYRHWTYQKLHGDSLREVEDEAVKAGWLAETLRGNGGALSPEDCKRLVNKLEFIILTIRRLSR